MLHGIAIGDSTVSQGVCIMCTELLNVSDLPKKEQKPFSRWLRSSQYTQDLYEMWKTAPYKLYRECGKGWIQIIDEAEDELASLGILPKHWLRIGEKFGHLRLSFAINHMSDEDGMKARKCAAKYAMKASKICMKCGSDKDVSTSTQCYFVTLCKDYHGIR